QATSLSRTEWNDMDDLLRVPWLEATFITLTERGDGAAYAPIGKANEEQPAQPEGVSSSNAAPKKLLTGWRQITTALDERYAERDRIKSLNDGYEGPIKN